MGLEIEHKFLVLGDDWRESVHKAVRLRQGYLNDDALRCSIRVRASDNRAWLNIKSATIGIQRQEFEYEIPLQDANEMLDTLARKPLIEKTRHFVKHRDHTWEIDEFEGDNFGLIIAEIELKTVAEPFEKPQWVGGEVSDDVRYYNTSLSQRPYNSW